MTELKNVNNADEPAHGVEARRLIRGRGHAALATSFDGQPYASLVATACEFDASPLLLLSEIAQHTRNLLAEPRVSLLFEATSGRADPLAGSRLTLQGRAERCDRRGEAARAAARFAARHPTSAAYSGFADFHLYRVVIERGHLVAGFGRIAWIGAANLRFAEEAEALAQAEPDIVAHMNEDHTDALRLYARRLLGRAAGDWRMTGIDPEGIDLRRSTGGDGETVRLDFAKPVLTPEMARRVLVTLAERARHVPDSA